MDYFNIAYLKDWTMQVDVSELYNLFMTTGGIYVLWTFAHFIASHAYVQLCTPFNIVGLISSPFMMASPHCQGLRWVIYEAGNKVSIMWGLLAGWVLAKIKTGQI